MKNTTSTYLRRRRTQLVKRLQNLEPSLIRGSLTERYKRCGKQGCKCMRGKGHGPKYYLTLAWSSQNQKFVLIVPYQKISCQKKQEIYW